MLNRSAILLCQKIFDTVPALAIIRDWDWEAGSRLIQHVGISLVALSTLELITLFAFRARRR